MIVDHEPGPDDAAAPLADVRVLEVVSGIAGQSVGSLLAGLGADVVSVSTEDPPPLAGADLPGWLSRSRGKTLARAESLDDLGSEGAGLLDGADVVLTDHPPSALARSRLGSDDIGRRAPGCLHVWMPAVAPSGVHAELPHDQLLLDGLSGYASYHPSFEERPVASVTPLRDALHGAMGAAHAAIGLLGRERSGVTSPIVVGGLRAAALATHLLMIGATDGSTIYAGAARPEGSAHYRLYETADGQWVFLGALGEVLFIEALTVLDRLDVLARADVAGEFGRLLDPDVTSAVGRDLAVTFATRTADEWVSRFAAADVPVAKAGARADWLRSEIVAHACPPNRHDHAEVGETLLPGFPIGLGAARDPAPPAATSDVVGISEVANRWTGSRTRRPTGSGHGPPLLGLRVVEMATYVAAPMIGSVLAAAGADVAKIEPPSGDPYRAYLAAFAAVNHGKRRSTIDLRSTAGREELRRLVSSADVLIDNLRPASLQRLGLDVEAIDAVAPRVVRASVTAFGHTGPWVDGPGFDPILQAMSGLAAAQGGTGRPIATGSPPHDLTTGMLGALGVAAALYERARHGRGRHVWLSLAATSTYVQAAELTDYAGRPAPPTGGPDHPGPSPWHRYHRAADGWLAVCARTDEERASFLDVLGLAGADRHDPSDLALRCAAGIRSSGVAEWLDRFGDAGVPCCRVVDRNDFESPDLVEAGYFAIADTFETGPIVVTNPFGGVFSH